MCADYYVLYIKSHSIWLEYLIPLEIKNLHTANNKSWTGMLFSKWYCVMLSFARMSCTSSELAMGHLI